MGAESPDAPDPSGQSGWGRSAQDLVQEAFPPPAASTEKLPFLKRPMGYSTVGTFLIVVLVLAVLFVLLLIAAALFAPDLGPLYLDERVLV